MLETKKLTKRFGGLTAVDSVNLQIERGQIHCLIGPNGAGKSTLFKLITGAHTPTEGEIMFNGQNITGLRPHERVRDGISMKYQDVKIFNNLTVNQNLRIALQKYNRTSGVERRRSELLEQIGLTNETRTIAGNLSHGQQQWLEIAMSVSADPELLLLDEPAAGMSIEDTNRTIDLIRALNDDGMTVIIVEHDMNFVREISDVITVLHDGKIFLEGKIDEIESNEEVQRIYLGEN